MQRIIVSAADDPFDGGDRTTTVTNAVNEAASDDAYDGDADATVTVTAVNEDASLTTVTEVPGLSRSGPSLAFRVEAEAEEEGDDVRGCPSTASSRNCDVEHVRRGFGGIILWQSTVPARAVAT